MLKNSLKSGRGVTSQSWDFFFFYSFLLFSNGRCDWMFPNNSKRIEKKQKRKRNLQAVSQKRRTVGVKKGIKSKRPQKRRFCQSQNWDLCLQDGDDYVNWNVSVSFISPFFFCRCVVLFMARVLKSVSSFKISDCFSLWYWPKSSTTPSIEHPVIPTIGQNTAFVGIEG